jgi:hypothetical protein
MSKIRDSYYTFEAIEKDRQAGMYGKLPDTPQQTVNQPKALRLMQEQLDVMQLTMNGRLEEMQAHINFLQNKLNEHLDKSFKKKKGNEVTF